MSEIITDLTMPKPEEKKKEVLHRKTFMNGQMTPEEAHRAYGIRKKCAVCGKPAAIRIKVLADLAELTKRQPEFVAAIITSNPEGQFVPTIDTTYGKMVKLSDVGACDNCKQDAEKASAKHPEWCMVEIDRGIKNVLQVGYGS